MRDTRRYQTTPGLMDTVLIRMGSILHRHTAECNKAGDDEIRLIVSALV